MRVIVISEGEWKPSKFDYGDNRRVTFKNIDNPKQFVYLNLTESQGVVDKWLPYIKNGNILDVHVPAGTRNVNKFGEFRLVKEVKNV